jgi:hypothetical protein
VRTSFKSGKIINNLAFSRCSVRGSEFRAQSGPYDAVEVVFLCSNADFVSFSMRRRSSRCPKFDIGIGMAWLDLFPERKLSYCGVNVRSF